MKISSILILLFIFINQAYAVDDCQPGKNNLLTIYVNTTPAVIIPDPVLCKPLGITNFSVTKGFNSQDYSLNWSKQDHATWHVSSYDVRVNGEVTSYDDNIELPLVHSLAPESEGIANYEVRACINFNGAIACGDWVTTATQCETICLENNLDFNVFEDINTSSRMLVWTLPPNIDFAALGITHFRITARQDDTVLDTFYVNLNSENRLRTFSLEANNYYIQACTQDQCGYAIYNWETNGYLQGITRLIDGVGIWNTNDPNNYKFRIRFKYPNSIFNTTYGKPDYFKITPNFEQPNPVAPVKVQRLNNRNGNCNDSINGMRCDGDNELWYSPEIPSDWAIGRDFSIKACRNDIGCGSHLNVSLGNPLISTDISKPVWSTGLNITVSRGTSVNLTWNSDVFTDSNVDYIEITEEQPVFYALSTVSQNEANEKMHVIKYYIENPINSGTGNNIGATYTEQLERLVKGNYKFSLSACKRNRITGDVCSANSNTLNVTLNREEISNSIIKNPTQFKFIDLTTGYDNDNNPIIKPTLVWNEPSLSPDYYLFSVDIFGGCEVMGRPSKIIDNAALNKVMVAMDNSVTQEMNMVYHSCKTIPITTKPLEISSCFEGVGCKNDPIEISVVYPIETTGSASLNINNGFGLSQNENNAGGPGDLRPGVWWNPKLTGTGWHFYWASELRYPSVHENYGETYDLIGVWLNYQLINNVWSPSWLISHLKIVGEGGSSCNRNTTQIYNCSEFFQGDLSYVTKSGNDLNIKRLGRLQVYFENSNDSNIKALLNLDIDSNNGILTGHSSHSTVGTLGSNCNSETPDEDCMWIDDNGNLNMPIFNFDQSILGNPAVGDFDNDINHYSGMWSAVDSQGNLDTSFTYLVDIINDLEWSAVLLYDDNGIPVWAQSDTCEGNPTCMATEVSAHQSTFKAISRGFDPLNYSPNDFWSKENNFTTFGTASRTFYNSNVTSFNEMEMWVDFDTTSLPGRPRIQLNSGSVGNETKLIKSASFHDIRFFTNDRSESESDLCDPNIDTVCSIRFAWFTDDDFPEIKPFYQKNGGPLKPLENLCGLSITNLHYVETEYLCDIYEPGEYLFELRKPQYENPNQWVTIAKSNTLIVLDCEENSNTCDHTLFGSNPQMIDQDPAVIGSMDSLMTHYPGDGPVPGSGGVSGGAATYYIPLTLPPGRNGMAPDVSINYSSKSGDGVMGVGWSVSAGSTIYRCPQTWAQDGKQHSVNNSNDDRVCLDGQRLMQVSTGQYWDNEAEYRTEIDSFNKVQYDKSNNKFVVYTKSGRINTYLQLGGGQKSSWYITNESDGFGNNIQYNYSTHGVNEVLINNISYTGYSTSSGTRQIQFHYETKESGYEVTYSNGIKFESTKQLDKITTHHPLDTKLRQYDFEYRTSDADGSLLLVRIDETAYTDKNDTKGTIRTLITAGSGWTDTVAHNFDTSWSNYSLEEDILVTDFSNDIDDNNIRSSLLNRANVKSDYNGDGIKDYLTTSKDGDKKKLLFFEQGVGLKLQLKKVIDLKDDWKYPNDMGGGDLNHDGVTDLLVMRKYQGCNNNDSDHTFRLEVVSWVNSKTLDSPGTSYNDFTNQQTICDIDLRYDTSGNDYSESNRIDEERSKFYITDFNGDGKNDIFFIKNPWIPSDQEVCWDEFDIGCNSNKTKIIYYQNTTVCDSSTSCNNIRFASGVELSNIDLQPFGDVEGEPDVWFYLWDNIDGIEDLNGDGYPDFRVTRWIRASLFQESNFRQRAISNRVYFTGVNADGGIVASDGVDYNNLGLNNFKCETRENEEIVENPCPYTDELVNHHANNFIDINGDGLLDYLYYDRGDQYVKKWKVRLNTGALKLTTASGNTTLSGVLFTTETYKADFTDDSTKLANNLYLPDAGVCDNLTANSDDALFRICNPYFSSRIQFADMNADGVSELLFPEPDPEQLPFNYCSRFESLASTDNSNKVLVANPDDTVHPVQVILSNFRSTVDEQNNLLPKPQITEHEQSLYLPSLGPIDDEIDFQLDDVSQYFNSQNNDFGSIPGFEEQLNGPQGNNYTQIGCAYSNNYVDESNNPIADIYKDYGGINALHDDSVYRYNSISFKLETGNKLQLNLNRTTGIYKPLRTGTIADLNGDSIIDSVSRVGCVKAADDMCLTASIADKTDWGQYGDSFATNDDLEEQLTPETYSGVSLAYRLNRPMPNMISRIEKPNTREWIEWDHLPISDNNTLYNIFERGNGNDGYLDEVDINNNPVFDSHFYFNSSMYVVDNMRVSNGLLEGSIESFDRTRYNYREAVYNNQGRGFQGFRKIVTQHYPNNTLNTQNFTKSVSIFHQVFPLAGKLAETRLSKKINGGSLKEINNQKYTWSNSNLSEYKFKGVNFYPILTSTEMRKKDDASSIVSEIFRDYSPSHCGDVTGSAYDGYGNLLCVREDLTDTIDVIDGTTSKTIITKESTITQSLYDYSKTSNWWIDKLDSTRVYKFLNESGTLTRPIDHNVGVLGSIVHNKFFWKSNKVRQLECQYTYDNSVTAPTDCSTDPSSSQIVKNQFTYDGYGNITNMDTIGLASYLADIPSTRSTSTTYDVNGYFPTSVNNSGIVTNIEYVSSTGQVLTQQNPDGLISENKYDKFNQVTKQKTYLSYNSTEDLFSQPTQIATQNCLLTNSCVGAQALVNSMMNTIKTDLNNQGYLSEYKGLLFENNVVHVPTLTYVTESRQLGSALQRTWLDQFGNPVLTRSQHAAGDNSNIFAYAMNLTNQLGQTEITTQPFSVSTAASAWAVIGPLPTFTFNMYDHRGRLVEKHQEMGQLSASTGNCWRKTVYSHSGALTGITASYSGTGCATDVPNNLTMYRSYDSAGKIRFTQDASDDKGQTEYWYDAMGNPYMVVDADDNIIETDFDSLGRKRKVIDPNMGMKTFAYNSFGELVRQQDAEQAANTLATYMFYDKLGRVTNSYSNVRSHILLNSASGYLAYHDQFDYCPGRTYLCNSYRYSNEIDGSLSTSFDSISKHSTEYTYDDFGRVSNELKWIYSSIDGYNSIPFETEYSYYDDYNFLKQTIYRPHGKIGYSTMNHYNVFGQMTKQTENTGQSTLAEMTTELIRYDSWNLRGQPTLKHYNNDNFMSSTYDYYSSTGQVKEISHGSTNVTDQILGYSYDAWGNLIGQELNNGSTYTETLTYDKLQRLKTSKVSGQTTYNYEYDKLGNLTKKSDYATSQTYGANGAGPNAITSSVLNNGAGSKYYEYDASGNRVLDRLNSTEIARYEYDAFNMLTYSDLNQGAEQIAFKYNENNQRYLKVEYSTDLDGATTQEVTFYGSPAYELIINDATGEAEAKFHIGDYLTVTRKDNRLLEKHFLQKDRLGSTTQILNESGDIIQVKGYDAFGKPRDGVNWGKLTPPVLDFENTEIPQDGSLTTDITKRGFTDHEHLDAFELIHMNGRMYDFNNGRFLSVDPFIQGTTSQAINPYSYIHNNPLSGVDPTGYAIINPVTIQLARSLGFKVAKVLLKSSRLSSSSTKIKPLNDVSIDEAKTMVDNGESVDNVFVRPESTKEQLGYENPAADQTDSSSSTPIQDQNNSSTITETDSGHDSSPVMNSEKGDISDTEGQSKPKDRSNAKRRAAREAQRQAGIPTSKSGKNLQNSSKPNQPRHQVKTGSDGQTVGVVDGSTDTNHEESHIEAGDVKEAEPINKHNQPRLKNNKSKVEYDPDEKINQ